MSFFDKLWPLTSVKHMHTQFLILSLYIVSEKYCIHFARIRGVGM
jgi:hypothetical protein